MNLENFINQNSIESYLKSLSENEIKKQREIDKINIEKKELEVANRNLNEEIKKIEIKLREKEESLRQEIRELRFKNDNLIKENRILDENRINNNKYNISDSILEKLLNKSENYLSTAEINFLTQLIKQIFNYSVEFGNAYSWYPTQICSKIFYLLGKVYEENKYASQAAAMYKQASELGLYIAHSALNSVQNASKYSKYNVQKNNDDFDDGYGYIPM